MQKPAIGSSMPPAQKGNLHKILLVMRLTVFLLTVSMMSVHAKGVSQSVTYTAQNADVKKIFTAIKEQTGYVVFYNQDVLEDAKPVSVDARNMPLDDFLELISKDQPFSYLITDKTISLSKKKPFPKVSQQNETIAGNRIKIKVVDDQGNALAGASITNIKTKTTVLTDSRGEVELDADNGDMVTITFVGFERQTVTVKNNITLIIALKISTSPLDEVQILAYGKTTQRYTTSNVQTVTAKTIEKQPVSNPLLALQGQVPGLVIQQQTGYANAGISVDIRGQGSLGLTSPPFYVVDGIPYPQQMLPGQFLGMGYSGTGSQTGSGTPGVQLGNTLSFINPLDIESISILKDADAVSIYGSRAAGGAILITTKKGKAGPTRVTVDLQQGWSKLTRFAKLLNGEQYLAMRREALYNDSVAGNRANTQPGDTDYDLNGVWDNTRNTDWQKILLGNTGKWSNATLAISGGNANTQYYFGGTYHKQTSIDLNPTGVYNQSASGHLSINSTSSNQKFTFQANVSYQFNLNRLPGGFSYASITQLAPVAPALFNADGSLNWQPLPNGNQSWVNPLADLFRQSFQQKVKNLLANTRLGYKIIPDVEIILSTGFTDMQQSDLQLVKGDQISYIRPSSRASFRRQAYYNNGFTSGWNIEPQLSYKKNFGRSHLDAVAGIPFQDQRSYQQRLQASGFIADGIMEDPTAASTKQYNSTFATIFRYNGYFARVNYNFDNKYIISVNGRRDGSSRFGVNNKFHSFGSVAGSWIFSNEAFAKNSKWLSFGKLTASYGTAGNDNIGEYQYLSSYESRQAGNTAYLGVPGLRPFSLSNPNLQWEVQRKFEGRLDLGFARDRILFSINYYRNRSSNQLLALGVPASTGYGSYSTNLDATIENSGTELMFKTTNIKTHDFSWTSSLNITLRRNKLVSYPGLEQSPYASSLIVGKPFSGTRAYKFAGVDPQTGIYQFYKADGTKAFWDQLDFSADANQFINTQPVFLGGFSNSLQYKGFQLDFLVQFSKQRQPRILEADYPGQFNTNQPVEVLNRWQKPGDHVAVQAYSSSSIFDQWYSLDVFLTRSDFAYPTSYYVRLKNLSLSWQLPKSWVSKVKPTDFSIFCNAQNLLTITNYIGTDPETGSGLPPLRVITAGIRVTL